MCKNPSQITRLTDTKIALSLVSRNFFRWVSFDILLVKCDGFLAFWHDNKFPVHLLYFLTSTVNPFLHGALVPFSGDLD